MTSVGFRILAGSPPHCLHSQIRFFSTLYHLFPLLLQALLPARTAAVTAAYAGAVPTPRATLRWRYYAYHLRAVTRRLGPSTCALPPLLHLRLPFYHRLTPAHATYNAHHFYHIPQGAAGRIAVVRFVLNRYPFYETFYLRLFCCRICVTTDKTLLRVAASRCT